MRIQRTTLKEIRDILGSRPVESGGIIGCKNGCICEFVLDESHTSLYEYCPDVAFLNGEIQKWNARGILFCGIAHSHLYGFSQPSDMDLGYARRLFNQGSNITELYFPIVTFDANGNTHVDFYQFLPEKDAFKKIKVCIVSELQEE